MRKIRKWWHDSAWGIDEEKSLLFHRWFWLLTVVPLVLGAALMLVAASLDNALWNIDFSSSGWKNFFGDYKVQLSLMALAIPLGATFSKMHSSAQTATTLRINSQQNNLKNAIEHAEFFKATLQRLQKTESDDRIYKILGEDAYYFYQLYYPLATKGVYENEKLLGYFKDFLERTVFICKVDNNKESFIEGLTEASIAAQKITSMFQIPKEKQDPYDFFVGGFDIVKYATREPMKLNKLSGEYRRLAFVMYQIIHLVEAWRGSSNIFSLSYAVRLKEYSTLLSSIYAELFLRTIKLWNEETSRLESPSVDELDEIMLSFYLSGKNLCLENLASAERWLSAS